MTHLLGYRRVRWMLSAATVLGIALACPYRPMVVVGRSMEPTYPNLSVVLMREHVGPLHRGDVVVLKTDMGTIVKRVAYLPGDKIWQMNSRDEGWIDMSEVQPRFPMKAHSDEFRQATIPNGELYVLGDNSQNSNDSRMFGCLRTDQVIGVVMNPRPRHLPNYTLQMPPGVQ